MPGNVEQVWTEGWYGEKNLRFSKYPDTCTRPHVKTLKIGHFHGLVMWWRQRDVQQIMMHAQAYCIFVFLVAVAVVGS